MEEIYGYNLSDGWREKPDPMEEKAKAEARTRAEKEARLASLKEKLASLKSKRSQWELAANRAKLGDMSGFYNIVNQESTERMNASNNAYNELKLKQDNIDKAQEKVNDLDRQLKNIDVELSKLSSGTERELKINESDDLEKKKNKILEAFDGMVFSTYKRKLPAAATAKDLKTFKEIFSQIPDDEWTDERKAEFIEEIKAASNEEGYGEFVKLLKKRPTPTEKAAGRSANIKAANEAIARLSRDDYRKMGIEKGLINKFEDNYGTYENRGGVWIRTSKK